MTDFKTTREHMVECQIEPGGVDNNALLEAFRTVPREDFLPEKYRSIACVDEDIVLSEGVFLVEPLVLGRLLQAANLDEGDIVLNIGDYTGYSSAILSELVTTIVTMEPKAGMLDTARKIWAAMDYCNIALIQNAINSGCPEHAPYDLIVLNGSVCEVPHEIKDQLTIGGRLVCVLRNNEKEPGNIALIERESETGFSQRLLYNATTPFLEEFIPVKTFSMKAFA